MPKPLPLWCGADVRIIWWYARIFWSHVPFVNSTAHWTLSADLDKTADSCVSTEKTRQKKLPKHNKPTEAASPRPPFRHVQQRPRNAMASWPATVARNTIEWKLKLVSMNHFDKVRIQHYQTVVAENHACMNYLSQRIGYDGMFGTYGQCIG